MSAKKSKDQDVAVKYLGTGTYYGTDQGAGNRAITVASGKATFVSKAKMDQLEEDFPDQWEPASAKEAAAAEEEAGETITEAAPAAADGEVKEDAPAAKPAKKSSKKK